MRPMRPHPLSHHSHAHVFLGAQHARNERRTLWVVGLTLVTMVVEIVAGTLYGSMALTADGWHMATHAGALGISAWAYRYARLHAHDARFTFGTGKIGDLAGFASALILALVAVGIGWESVVRLRSPIAIQFDEAILVAVIGLGVNLASAWLLMGGADGAHSHDHTHGHTHGHAHGHAHAHDDQNLRAAYLHVMTDALTSVLAIAALVAGRWAGWYWLDPVAGVLGAVIIARWSWGLLRQTAAVLLDASVDLGLGTRIRAQLESDEEKVSDLHVWQVGPGQYACIVALVTAQPREPEHYRARLRGMKELVHITVEAQRCEGPHEHDPH
jgi:cation diffusion facilitator family transporter